MSISKQEINRVLLNRIDMNNKCLSGARESKHFEEEKYFSTLIFEDKQIKALIEESAPSSENTGEWIPVSERLPEDGEWAIFTDGSTISVERYKFDAIKHFYPQGRWFSFDNATAWMPLPEPYKAESEEQ